MFTHEIGFLLSFAINVHFEIILQTIRHGSSVFLDAIHFFQTRHQGQGGFGTRMWLRMVY